MAVDFVVQFEEEIPFNIAFSESNETFDAGMGQVTQIVTSDHRELTHKDATNQHPISSITGLQTELDDLETEALTNLEIQSILNS